MKDFIEVITPNGNQVLVAVSSIAIVDHYTLSQARIVLKEIISEPGMNEVIICRMNYNFVKGLIQEAQKL